MNNLKQLGTNTDDKCYLCGNKSILYYVYNFYWISLMHWKYSYRLNAIIHHIIKSLKSLVESKCLNVTVEADVKNYVIYDGTIPHYILPTQQQPNICIVEPDSKVITLLELGVPFEPNIIKAGHIKNERCSSLVADINRQCELTD